MPRKLARKSAAETEPEPEGEPEEPEAAASAAEPEVDVEAPEVEWRPEPLLFDVSTTCFMLGNISKQMLYRLIHLGQIKPVKVGTRSMFTRAELKRFVDEREQEGAA